jgi:ThiF family
METVSTRHEGDLDQRLVRFTENRKMRVTLLLGDSASQAAVQHSAWMLANLLARLEGYVENISICCPSAVQIHPSVFPFQIEARDFREALISATSLLEIVPVTVDEREGLIFSLGPGDEAMDGWRVYGNGWVGGITRGAAPQQPQSDLPFGPYVAACFAASEVFKRARMRDEHYISSKGFYDTWSLRAHAMMPNKGPLEIPNIEMNCILAGVGAVGNAFLHTMASCPSIRLSAVLADDDHKGVEITNLNRYVLFTKRHLNMLKADAACELLQKPHLKLRPHNGPAQTVSIGNNRVLSAVDTNRAREAIQFLFPARVISASTSDLRVEAHRCGPPGHGACLRCYNPPEALPADHELAARMKNGTLEELKDLADQAGVSMEAALNWLNTEKCGEEGARLLQVLRDRDGGGGRFAVGFTSVLAGVLLATEFIKDSAGYKTSLDGINNHAVFQFFETLSDANESSYVARDQSCPACGATRPSFAIWNSRFTNLGPARQ